MTETGLSQVMSLFEQAYGVTFTAEQQRVWLMILNPLSDDEAQRAAVATIRESQYVPKPSDLWRRARPKIDTAERDRLLELEADRAIAHLEANLTDMAADFGACLNAVVRAFGGLQAVVDLMIGPLGNGNDAEWRYRRGEAKRLYIAYRLGGVPEALAGPVSTTRWAEQMDASPPALYLAHEIPVPRHDVVPFHSGIDIPGLPETSSMRQLP